jgi:hypothetical protein
MYNERFLQSLVLASGAGIGAFVGDHVGMWWAGVGGAVGALIAAWFVRRMAA